MERLEAIFQGAADLRGDERAAYLARECLARMARDPRTAPLLEADAR